MSEFGGSDTRASKSPWGKWLTGCGLGCLIVALLGTVTCMSLWWWATSPGKQFQPAALLTEADHGLVAADGLGTDPGLRALTLHALQEWQRAASEGAGNLQFGPWSAAQEPEPGDLQGLPQDLAMLLLSSPERVAPVGVVNLTKGPRFLRFVIDLVWPDQGGASTSEHRGHSVRTIGGSVSAAFVGSTILVGARPGDVNVGIDRTLDAAGAASPEVAALRERWDVWGRFRDRDGRAGPWVAAVLLSGAQRAAGADGVVPPLEGLSGAVFGLDVLDADSGRGEVTIDFVDEAAANAWAPLIGPAVEALVRRWAGETVEIRADLQARGAQVTGPLEVRGLEQAVSRVARFGAETLERKTEEQATP